MSTTPIEVVIQGRHLKPVEIARAADVSVKYLHLVRRGKVEPSVTRALRITAAISKLARRRFSVDEFWAA